MFTLFNILALLYIFRSVQLVITIAREWSSFTSEPLTPRSKSLADQASFFVAVPIAVFVHELAHALAVIAFGGEVAEFNYRVFWGYVVPRGSFTDAQMWVIAIAGTIGSLLVGLLLWLWLRNAKASSVRYFALRALRFQIYFSLIYYPLFTLLGFDGDWRTIYNFATTPLLSAVTMVLHIAILYAFWRFDRQGWFEAPAFASIAAQEQFEQLSAVAAANPQDIGLQLQRIDMLRRGGATHKARYELDRLAKDHPESGLVQLERAALLVSGKESATSASAQAAQSALDLGLATPQQQAFALELIGQYKSERGQLQEAASSYGQAIELISGDATQGGPAATIDLLIRRSQVYRRLGQYEAAYSDLQQALTLAQRNNDPAAAGRVRSESEILAKNAGQPYLAIPAEL
ncbi:MAG: M50 family metallopeptidase [Candidatus Promineifilaceae bacterium]